MSAGHHRSGGYVCGWTSDAIGIPAWGVTTDPADVMAIICPHGMVTFVAAVAIALLRNKWFGK